MMRGMMFSNRAFVFTHTTNAYDPNLPNLAVAAGWNQSDHLIVNLNGTMYGGVNIKSGWGLPAGITLNISANTTLYGAVDINGAHLYGGAGLTVQRAAVVNNLGAIRGAGGGKGPSIQMAFVLSGSTYYCSGGNGGVGKAVTPAMAFTSQAGGSGNSLSFGGGAIWAQGGQGDPGGDWATAGGSGGGVTYSAGWNNVYYTRYASQGLPGNAVTGDSYITWVATGTRQGAIA